MTPSGTRTRGRVVIEKGQLVAGRYRLLDTIGSGAMGIVWQARDERLDRTVAIKQLLMRAGLSESQAADARRRAMREGRIAARLQHRNAIALFDVAEHDGDPCLIMEYLPSLSLSGLLAERGTLSPEETAQIGVQVATALTAAHAAGIVHRDVKPGNILIDDSGTVKITDFGISRSTDDGTMTQSSVGMLAGTPAYLAPEVARGQDPTRASDVFSLGATLYHAIEGQPPYGFKDNPLAQLYAVAMGKVPEPKQAGSMSKTLMELLKLDPADRPTMPELVTTLGEIAGGATVVVPKIAAPPKQQAPVPAAQATLIAPAPAPGAPTAVQAPPKPPPQQPVAPPAPPPPVPPAKKGGSKRVAAIIGAIVVAAVLGGVIATVLSTRGSGDNNNANSPAPVTPPQQTVTVTTGPPEPPPSAPSAPSNPSGNDGTVAWGAAGELLVAYYNRNGGTAGMWAMLTPSAQQVFGDFAAFEAYWAQYPQVSGRTAQRVSGDADGGQRLTIQVNYGGRQESRNVRVVSQGGKLLIDSDAK
ncbi:serine/threonine-protein kinase [Kibdelosporangium aridum]|uniref:serine/threonine-protein kinase n=1 Tax=Kibdelosporangium aridum TaxID=2030 RepID=UPI000AD31638|nr:serine/threonine-protein kinase [Kibdelosporangium aridum]